MHGILVDIDHTPITPPPSMSSVLIVPLFLASLFALIAAICSMDMASPKDQIWSVMAPFVLPVCFKKFTNRSYRRREEEKSTERKKKVSARRGARTHDPQIKSLMLYRLS